MKKQRFTAVLNKEDDWYVALCPELDVASQGQTVEKALDNLKEAVELFLETAAPAEIKGRLRQNVIIAQFEAAYA